MERIIKAIATLTEYIFMWWFLITMAKLQILFDR